jgi:hypothetical protein
MSETVCSIGKLIHNLCMKNIKCHCCNHDIEDEQTTVEPDNNKIARLLLISVRANGERVRLRNAINKQLAKAIKK